MKNNFLKFLDEVRPNGLVGRMFNPWLSQTKVLKNGT